MSRGGIVFISSGSLKKKNKAMAQTKLIFKAIIHGNFPYTEKDLNLHISKGPLGT